MISFDEAKEIVAAACELKDASTSEERKKIAEKIKIWAKLLERTKKNAAPMQSQSRAKNTPPVPSRYSFDSQAKHYFFFAAKSENRKCPVFFHTPIRNLIVPFCDTDEGEYLITLLDGFGS